MHVRLTGQEAVTTHLGNADSEVKTGNTTAACGGVQRRAPRRKLSVGDLHIRSHDEDSASSCREIRAILREIRDSLSSEDTGPSAAESVDVDVTATSKCVDEDVQVPRRTDVEQRHQGDIQRSGWRRHCRLSLPARLRSGGVDGLVDGDLDGVASTRTGRRRVPANVRFADEVGMNLNTFAMIPCRQVRDDSPTCVPLTRVNTASVKQRRHASPPPPPQPHHVSLNGCREGRLADGRTQQVDVELKSDDNQHENHEQFRLCFKQPFAELEQFRSRLDRQLVCLENVRVDDWAAAAHHHGTTSNSMSVSATAHQPSSAAANSVILCSIQTKNISGRDHLRDVRVFARCTSDNWRTFADLPAQRVTGLDSLGLGYHRYCFAVRRPVTADPCPASTCDRRHAAAVDEPSAAVEFAVCYETTHCAFWDNNDEANYRIEWFQNDT